MSQPTLLEAVLGESLPAITFEVFGRQSPQGSKQAQVIYRKGPDGKPIPVTKNGRVLTVARNDSPTLLSWRGAIVDAARRAYSGPLLLGAISLALTFERPRPKSHFTSKGMLKSSAPAHPLSKPDNTKLRRAVEDALAGVVYRDDSQIVTGSDQKCYGERFRTVVSIVEFANIADAEDRKRGE